MWQVYLYLANERQVRERDTRVRDRERRLWFDRRARRNMPRPEEPTARDSATTPDRRH